MRQNYFSPTRFTFGVLTVWNRNRFGWLGGTGSPRTFNKDFFSFWKKRFEKIWGNRFPQNDGGTSSPSLKNAKMRSKKMSPRHGNENMDMSMDKPIALNRTEGTRGPQVEKSKNEVKNKLPWASPAYDLKNANFQNFAVLRAHRYHRREKPSLRSMSD